MTVELTIGNTAGWRLFEALFPEGTTGYLEVRAIRDGDVRQRRFVPLDDRNWGWRHVRGDAKFADIFFGVAPRTRQEGTKEAIAEVHAAWADLDSEDAATTLGLFDLPPSFVVSTGSEGHLHAFLAEPAAPAEIEAINRALAERLGADPVAVDASRMMRMPGTYNFKHDPPVKATLVEANEQRFSLAELEGALELDAAAEQHGEGPADPGPDPGTPVARVLERLEGVNPSGGGWQALCPAHDDQHPSLSVAEGDDGRCLLKCHAGCTTQAVIDALDLTWGDLFAGQTGTGAKAILDLVEATGAEPIRDPSGKTYIRIPVGDHVETWRTGSRAFKDWVRMLVLESAGRIAAAQSLKDAVDTLSAQAARGPNELDVHTRVAASDQNSYLDLCDKDWRTVEIRPGAWSVISASPVPFTRRGAMQALAEPVGGAPLEDLRCHVNLPQDGQWRLFLAVAVSYLLGRGPFPVLILQGGQGSCKSTAARVLRELIDPAKGALRVGQPDPRELMIAATANWIVAFDNITSISPRFSDAVCQLATGAGFGARALWTDDEEFVFDAMRPVIFTGIGGFARRPDLLDRAVLLELPAVDPADRLPEGDFWVDFDNARPQLLGALLDTSAEALATLAKIDPPRLPRMADFARIGIAVERVLDWPEGAFLEALTENSELSLSASLEADPLASVVIKFAESLGADGVWAGEPAETYTKLSERATDELTRRRTWPGDAASMSRRLKELSHALRLVGVEVEWGWTGRDKSRRRQITIRLNEDGGDGGDGSG